MVNPTKTKILQSSEKLSSNTHCELNRMFHYFVSNRQLESFWVSLAMSLPLPPPPSPPPLPGQCVLPGGDIVMEGARSCHHCHITHHRGQAGADKGEGATKGAGVGEGKREGATKGAGVGNVKEKVQQKVQG